MQRGTTKARQSQSYRARLARAFGQTLRQLRESRGLTQQRLSEIAGVDRTYPSMVERGLRMPRLEYVMHMAKACGVSAAQLVQLTSERLNSEQETN